jgi:hypothetical protein
MIHDVDFPVLIVSFWKVGAEMAAAALLAAQRRPGDQPPDRDEMKVAPRIGIRRRTGG